MTSGRITVLGDGRFALSGDLGFSSVMGLLRQSDPLFATCSEVVLDLSQVERADSAGLALLVEWLRRARRRGQRFRVLTLPQALADIAQVSNIITWLVPERSNPQGGEPQPEA